MNQYPDSYLPIYVHAGLGDPYEVPFGSQRVSFYSVGGYPTHWLDGYMDVDPRDSDYEAAILNRAASGTDVTMSFAVVENAVDDYSVSTTVCIEPGGEGKTMRIYLAQLLDNFPTSQYYYRNCLMQGQSLGDLTLNPGECGSLNHTFTFNATSMSSQEDIKLAAWAQVASASGPADVHQATQLEWPFLDANFSNDPTHPAVSELVQFNDETAGRATDSWVWDFGDGVTSTLQNPTHSFLTADCHDVSLTVTSGPYTDDRTKVVSVGFTPPEADFLFLPKLPDVDESVQFTDMSTGDIDSWSWDFGDGNTSTLQNPIHTYTTNGDFVVTLTTDGPCESSQTTTTISVCETVPPVADWERSTSGTVPVGQGMFFFDRSSNDVVSWLWDFGDGTTSTSRNVYKSFTFSGSFDVSLTVSSGCLEDSYTETVDVCELPTAAFSNSPALPVVGQPVTFTDESTGGAVEWAWDFGDGGSSTLQNPTHTYSSTGDFTVQLTVIEALGCSGQTTGDLQVVVGDLFADGFEDGNSSAWSVTVP